jgi:hypothetical protein
MSRQEYRTGPSAGIGQGGRRVGHGMQLHTGAELFGNVVNCGITEQAVVKRVLYISEMSQTCDICTYSCMAPLLEMRRVARP